MAEELTDYRVIVRTGKLHFLDTADLALKEAGIPHYLQEERVSGLIEAMPAAPSPEPGTWWNILVPASDLSTASGVIEGLPFVYTTNPGVWDCAPSDRGKKLIKTFVWVAVAWIVAGLLLGFFLASQK